MVRNNYYFLGSDEKSSIAVAYTLGTPPISYELISILEGKNKLPFDLVLKKVIPSKNGLKTSLDLSGLKHLWQDYQPNCLAWSIMSEKMKSIIEKNLLGEEHIDWIEVNIIGLEEKKKYFVLRFNKKLDVLDLEKTTFISGTDHIVKPCFSSKKIKRLALFNIPESKDFWKIPSGIYVNQVLKEDFEANNLTGMEFDQIAEARIS